MSKIYMQEIFRFNTAGLLKKELFVDDSYYDTGAMKN